MVKQVANLPIRRLKALGVTVTTDKKEGIITLEFTNQALGLHDMSDFESAWDKADAIMRLCSEIYPADKSRFSTEELEQLQQYANTIKLELDTVLEGVGEQDVRTFLKEMNDRSAEFDEAYKNVVFANFGIASRSSKLPRLSGQEGFTISIDPQFQDERFSRFIDGLLIILETKEKRASPGEVKSFTKKIKEDDGELPPF